MKHEYLSDAIEELHREGVIKSGWSIKGSQVVLVQGDAMPGDSELQAALRRRTARLRDKKNQYLADETTLLTKLKLTRADLRKLKRALDRIDLTKP